MFNLNVTTKFIGILTGYFIYGSARRTAITIQTRVLNIFSQDYYPDPGLRNNIKEIEEYYYE